MPKLSSKEEFINHDQKTKQISTIFKLRAPLLEVCAEPGPWAGWCHRLSTIVNADKIFVLEDGRIIESGTYTELLRRGGLYQDLYIRQFQSAYASLDTLNGEMVNKVIAN